MDIAISILTILCSFGVTTAVIRAIYGGSLTFKLWIFLLPGYILVCALVYMAAKLDMNIFWYDQVLFPTVGLALILGSIIFTGKRLSLPIQKAISSLNCGSEQITADSHQMVASSQSLAAGASQQAASIEETSSSLEEVFP